MLRHTKTGPHRSLIHPTLLHPIVDAVLLASNRKEIEVRRQTVGMTVNHGDCLIAGTQYRNFPFLAVTHQRVAEQLRIVWLYVVIGSRPPAFADEGTRSVCLHDEVHAEARHAYAPDKPQRIVVRSTHYDNTTHTLTSIFPYLSENTSQSAAHTGIRRRESRDSWPGCICRRKPGPASSRARPIGADGSR